MKEVTDIKVERVDFSDPQGDKGHATEEQPRSKSMFFATLIKDMMQSLRMTINELLVVSKVFELP